MKGLKIHLHYILLEFKQEHNNIETSRKIYSAYDEEVITDGQVWNWFAKYPSVRISLEDEPRLRCSLEFEDVKSLVESNR